MMSIADLHAWATEHQDAADARLCEAARAVLKVLKERADLITTEYLTLREDLRIANAARAAYRREHARLRSLLNAQNSAPWDEPSE